MIFKRCLDLVFALIALVVLLPVMVILALLVKMDSTGPIFFSQKRITQYGREFNIYKFRTMVVNAESIGSLVTVGNDDRITRMGQYLRKYRLDELPQFINIIIGDMSFVGTRPEVPKYVDCYTDTMKATLLMPAGVTSLASIKFRNEDDLLSKAQNVDEIYLNRILPIKMKYNLLYLERFSLLEDIILMIKTVVAVFSGNVSDAEVG